jgi:hypothetical protein
MSLAIVLLSASTLDPKLLGVEISPRVMWLFLGIAHIYFFVMWRLTTIIENDQEKYFWNLRGLWRQAMLRGTKDFPGKMKAQVIFLRSMPIWAFVVGLISMVYGFICKS